MKTLDIVTTAVIRPDILDRTYGTFKEHCFKDYPIKNVIINVDPVGVGDADNMSNVARKHFPDSELHIRRPFVPNFAEAFMWTWKKANADYVFNLEDDWECLYDVPVSNMIKFMEDHPDIGSIRLSLWESESERVRAVTSSMRPYNFIPYNAEDGFFELLGEQKERLGVSGHPTLYRGDLIRVLRLLIDPRYNPEKFLRHAEQPQMVMTNWRVGVWIKPDSPAQIRDIGEAWRKQHGFLKAGGIEKGNKEWFLYHTKDEHKELKQ